MRLRTSEKLKLPKYWQYLHNPAPISKEEVLFWIKMRYKSELFLATYQLDLYSWVRMIRTTNFYKGTIPKP